MIVVLQRVTEARVEVEARTIGAIGKGLMVLVCAEREDTEDKARQLAQKLLRYRVFEDEAGKMNRSVADVAGALLLISQFTLAADTDHGNRPSFSGAARPELAMPLYDAFCAQMRTLGIPTETGVFGADMKLDLLNDGPVTIVMDARDGKVL